MGTGVAFAAPAFLETAGAAAAAEAAGAAIGAGAGIAGGAAAGITAGVAGGLGAAAAGGISAGALASGALAAGGVLSSLKTAATIASPLVGLAQAASGIKAAKINRSESLKVSAPPPMPIFGGPNQLNALRADIQEQLMRRGRAASILTAEAPVGERLGS